MNIASLWVRSKKLRARESCCLHRHINAGSDFFLQFLDSLFGSNLVSLRLLLLAKLFLKIFSSLETRCGRGRCTGLPGGSTDVADALGVLEHSGDFLKRLPGRFREAKEDVKPHGNAEDTEDNVGVPSDVDEGGRNEVAKSEVESPV